MPRRCLIISTCFAALIAVAARADTLTVPGDFSTIQAAIDASSNGDEIAVAPGVYGSNTANVVDMKGRAVRLYATGGPDVTIIDGNDGTIRRRGILCQSGETNATVIEGFTIRNCFPTWYDWNENELIEIWEFFGGGMWNRGGSSPRVVGCRFENNSAEYGGAICNWDQDDLDNRPRLENCTFTGNTAGFGVGGAIYANGSWMELFDCTFVGNSAYFGGAITSMQLASNPTLVRCRFEQNNATMSGGALYTEQSAPSQNRCTYEQNSAGRDGGAIFSAGQGVSSLIPTYVQCEFNGNLAGDEGGAVHNFSISPAFLECAFRGNVAIDGGAIYNWNGANPELLNNVFCQNGPDDIDGNWNGDGNQFNETCDNDDDCPADLNGDGEVGGADLTIILSNWGCVDQGCEGDLTGDDLVGGADLTVVLSNWGGCGSSGN